MKSRSQLIVFLLAIGVVPALLFFILRRPLLFSNTRYLGAILAIEVVLACLWQFQKVFFPATMWCFLSAGTALPFSEESMSLRWLFLAAGALVGLVIWMRSDRAKHFGAFHLVALFAVFAALASASASDVPTTALLKVGSLFLLFLYCATAGRVALQGREKAFVNGMVWACEILVFVTTALYFVGIQLFGNPNNLGAFIGVAAAPVLLWAGLVAESRGERQRHYTVLGLCGILLYLSVCRAAIVADGMVIIVLTIALRRPRLLLKAAFVVALVLEVMAVANPSHAVEFADSLSGKFVFKIERNQSSTGLLASRETPWEETLTAIKRHPWLGTGFGTSDMGTERPDIEQSSIYTKEGSNREHGSSYLALVEYMGLAGILPFLLLLLLLIRVAARMFSWMRQTGSPHHYGVPFALVALAGLIHAGFEDWLFAAGSYLCVFFWVSAFLLVDLVPPVQRDMRIQASGFSKVAPAGSFLHRIPS
jgi:O-antigen ligase